jgi:phosphatidylglycerophosphate synthase
MSSIDYARNVVRAQARSLARLLNRLTAGKLTPNMVTAIGIIMHVPIALLIADRHFIWAVILLVFFGLFDVLDGELARLQRTASSRGMLYDATADRIKETLLYAGIAYALVANHQAQWAFVAVVACGFSITVSYAKAKGEAALALKRTVDDHHTLNRRFKDGVLPYELRMTIVALGLITNQLLIASTVVATLALLTVFGRLRTISEQL